MAFSKVPFDEGQQQQQQQQHDNIRNTSQARMVQQNIATDQTKTRP